MVVISDMEHIPKSCYDCDFHNYHFCDMTGNCVEQNIDNGTRADDCPLKEVPNESILDKIKAEIVTDYENRLKADMVAMLTEIQLEIHELENPYPHDYDNLLPLAQHNAFYDAKSTIEDLVEQKIDKLKEA